MDKTLASDSVSQDETIISPQRGYDAITKDVLRKQLDKIAQDAISVVRDQSRRLRHREYRCREACLLLPFVQGDHLG
jgi:hypothetical protein